MIPIQTPPAPLPTPGSTAPEQPAGAVLEANTTMVVLAVGVVVLFLVVGLIVILGRWTLGTDSSTDSVSNFVRSWLGLGLVGGLLVLCVVSLGLNDPTLRSTLFGGLIANVGAATAFYFASSGSDQARKDILAASLPGVLVPDLDAKSPVEAEALIAKLPLRLELVAVDTTTAQTVVSQDPVAGRTARPGDTVVARLKP